ncbi:MAG: glutamine-hydrolyzing GMP synthase [Candidatus Magasanikbacteria bacterium]
MQSNNEIAILDFGSQYTHLIGRRIRELGVISHIYHNDASADKLKNVVGIILSGGPRSVARDPKLAYDPAIFKLGIPILGLCYGHQLMADVFGGAVGSGQAREYGLANMSVFPAPIFKKVPKKTTVWMSHGDHVSKMPLGFKQIATTGNDSVAAMYNPDKNFYGFQFHPEVNHTKAGKIMLNNFVFDICKAKKNWTTATMLAEIEADIKKQAGDKNVFLLVSGGVDSTVCFALLEKVLGKKRVYGLHVDSGMMRLNESALVKTTLCKAGFDNLHVYNAEAEYLEALKGVTEPETKRKIIGDLFLDIVDKVMAEKKMDNNDWLIGQGTIYPDTIESGGTKNADRIKTHHNRVPRIVEMIAEGKIIEPIRELYKDEVRAIGKKLGLPGALISRHPFPGPGLGIRCLCGDGTMSSSPVILSGRPKGTPSGKDLSRLSSPRTRGSALGKSQIPVFTGMTYRLPLRSVGVQGDERSYAHPALIIPSKLNNTAWKQFETIAPQITNSHKEINRVMFLLSGDKSKITTSQLNSAYLAKVRLDLLRKIDTIVNKYILADKNCKHIWQLPVVIVPFGYDKKESIVLRPVESEEAMTVSFARIPDATLKKIVKEISALNAVDFIFYDITNKPPGTIEWE